MSQDKVRYNANPKIDFSSPPAGDRVVTWFSSSAEFGLSRNEINQPIYIYEFFEDNRNVQKGYQAGNPSTTPSITNFKALPNGQTSTANTYNIEYYSGFSNDVMSIDTNGAGTEQNYLLRGLSGTEIVLFVYDIDYSQHFACFNAQLASLSGIDVYYTDLQYLDYMYNPAPQNFDFDIQSTTGGNFFNKITNSNNEYSFVAMSPDFDGDQGLMYINGPNSNAARLHNYIILNSKPSGSNQDISDYLRCFGGGRLQIVDVTDTDNNLIYKFDESFTIYNDGTAENRYVAFKGCKLLASSGTFGTVGQKFAVTVIPHVNEFQGLAGAAGNYFSGPTPTVVREVILDSKGDTSRVGRRYEWGDRSGGDYWGSTDNVNELLGGNYQFKAFYRYGANNTRFIKEGPYSLNNSSGLETTGFRSPGGQGLNMVDFYTLKILEGYGPYLEIEWDTFASSGLTNAPIKCWVYWNWSPRQIQIEP